MKLMIIRHGDPNYAIDSLTEKGWREAKLLAERMAKEDVKEFYVSPLGRAQDTASLTLQKMNREATVCQWLREFCGNIIAPHTGQWNVTWDWLPQDWTKVEEYYSKDLWHTTDTMQFSKVIKEYQFVTKQFDQLLAGHGYVREGNIYRVEQANTDTLVFFCHFGLECVLLSHLTGMSPMVFWHGFCAAPTSVTTVYTEERRKGIASFRIASFGDISHLYVAGEEPAFSARFCETYDNMAERHD